LKSNLSELFEAAEDVPADVRQALESVRLRLGPMATRVHWLTSTGSTNDVAARLADAGAAEGTTVVARTQTSGRGRHGHMWLSPVDAGLYVSIVLRPSASTTLLTLAAGVAIAEAVRTATGLPADIKWPNDIMIGSRKLAGILAEAAAQSGAVQYVILGIGLNLRAAAYPAELAPRITSIEAETTQPADRALLLSEMLAALGERYGDLQSQKFDAILASWRRLAPSLPDARVEWDSPSGIRRGRAHDIDADGALLIRVDGRLERACAGEIRWL
jgi:BirA family transcriptional regulator, biotin operon repressor / biotin---[acetyl-CoA-carboxylase] ligase